MQKFPLSIVILGFLLLFIIIVIQIEVFTMVLSKLGLSRSGASLLLITTFLGSALNLPVTTIRSNFSYEPDNPLHRAVFPLRFTNGHTLIAVNVGGALVPITFSVYLIITASLPTYALLISILVISVVSYLFSRPVANLGIGMPIFVAPVMAALTAMLLLPDNAPALAYISGSLGVVVGADLLRIKDIKKLNAPVASIGGAGTFDGIFLTGIIAVILTF
mgnify:CR=1 FL=1